MRGMIEGFFLGGGRGWGFLIPWFLAVENLTKYFLCECGFIKERIFFFLFLSVCLFLFLCVCVWEGEGGGVGKYYLALIEALGIFLPPTRH